MLHFAGSALCLAGLCRSLVTLLPRQPTGPGSNLRHLSAATAGATGCASSPGSASTSRAQCSPSSTRHRCRQPKWYRHRSEPFDERSAWTRSSAHPAPHWGARRPWHFFELRKSAKKTVENAPAERPDAVNNCAHTLVVLVLCVFGTCRAFLLAEVFLTRCPFVKFSCAPVFVCLKGP